MKLIIDIPDNDYEKLKDGHIPFSILKVMQNGTPLPKGHGRLIDGDRFNVISYSHTSDDFDNGVMWLAEQIDNAPTIIEADTEPMYYPQVDGITPTVATESEVSNAT